MCIFQNCNSRNAHSCYIKKTLEVNFRESETLQVTLLQDFLELTYNCDRCKVHYVPNCLISKYFLLGSISGFWVLWVHTSETCFHWHRHRSKTWCLGRGCYCHVSNCSWSWTISAGCPGLVLIKQGPWRLLYTLSGILNYRGKRWCWKRMEGLGNEK